MIEVEEIYTHPLVTPQFHVSPDQARLRSNREGCKLKQS